MKDSHVESQQRLQHIIQAIADIEKFVGGETMETFCEGDMLDDEVFDYWRSNNACRKRKVR